MSLVKCSCVLKTAPTYETYIQTPCDVHRRAVEDAVAAERERCALIVGERGCATCHDCANRVAAFIRDPNYTLS